jgi:hypothetical protein
MSPDSSLAALPRPITLSGLGDPATLRAQLDTAAQGADRQAVHSTASQQQLEEAFVMQTSAGGRSDSIDEWDPLITSYHTKAAPAISVTAVPRTAASKAEASARARAAAAATNVPTLSLYRRDRRGRD